MAIEIDKIIRSRRKTVGLIITEEARLIVRAPYGVSKNRIMEIVKAKSKWIEKKQTEIKARNQAGPTGEFKEGEVLYYLGKPYRIQYRPKQESPIVIDNTREKSTIGNIPNEAIISVDNSYRDKKEVLVKLLIDFYKEQTRKEIEMRIGKISKLYGFHYRRVRISRANKRLGSCSSLGNINFSWRLSMAPPEVIDYIVIHELAHLKEQNHSKRFWRIVEKMMPNYRACRKWIRENYHLLKLPVASLN